MQQPFARSNNLRPAAAPHEPEAVVADHRDGLVPDPRLVAQRLDHVLLSMRVEGLAGQPQSGSGGGEALEKNPVRLRDQLEADEGQGEARQKARHDWNCATEGERRLSLSLKDRVEPGREHAYADEMEWQDDNDSQESCVREEGERDDIYKGHWHQQDRATDQGGNEEPARLRGGVIGDGPAVLHGQKARER